MPKLVCGAHTCGQVLPSDGCFDVESLQVEHVFRQYYSVSITWMLIRDASCFVLSSKTLRRIFALSNDDALLIFELVCAEKPNEHGCGDSGERKSIKVRFQLYVCQADGQDRR